MSEGEIRERGKSSVCARERVRVGQERESGESKMRELDKRGESRSGARERERERCKSSMRNRDEREG